MPPAATFLKRARQFHLYLGVFSAPCVLFFAITGALQSLNLHETLPGRNYKPAAWIVMLAQVHKKQTLEMRKPRSESSDKSAKSSKANKPSAPVTAVKVADTPSAPVTAVKVADTPSAPVTAVKVADTPSAPVTVVKAADTPAPKPKSHLGLKIFFALVSLALAYSTVSGIYMAYKYNRSKVMIAVLLLAGIAVPLLLLPF